MAGVTAWYVYPATSWDTGDHHSLFLFITRGEGEPSREDNEIAEKASHY